MLNFTDPTKKENYFLSQPHQPFFAAGIFWAVVLMFIFALAYRLLNSGTVLLQMNPTGFHAYGLIYIVISQFFIGFLYTTFPKFCALEPIKKSYYLITFYLYQVGSVLFVAGVLYNELLFIAGMLTLFAAMLTFFYKLLALYLASAAAVKRDQFWILVALTVGTATHLLAILEVVYLWPQYAYAIAFTLYITFLTFSVAQRMVPFFSHSQVQKKNAFLPLIFLLLVLKVTSLLTDRIITQSFIDMLLFVILLKEFLRWKLNTKGAPAILKILHIALFWLPFGLLLGALATFLEALTLNSFLFAQTHLIALGFVITMLIGFGTRVTLGHSGQPPHADKTTLKIFYLTQILVLARFVYSLFFGLGFEFLWLFDLSVMLWMVLFIFWSSKFGPVLLFGTKK